MKTISKLGIRIMVLGLMATVALTGCSSSDNGGSDSGTDIAADNSPPPLTVNSVCKLLPELACQWTEQCCIEDEASSVTLLGMFAYMGVDCNNLSGSNFVTKCAELLQPAVDSGKAELSQSGYDSCKSALTTVGQTCPSIGKAIGTLLRSLRTNCGSMVVGKVAENGDCGSYDPSKFEFLDQCVDGFYCHFTFAELDAKSTGKCKKTLDAGVNCAITDAGCGKTQDTPCAYEIACGISMACSFKDDTKQELVCKAPAAADEMCGSSSSCSEGTYCDPADWKCKTQGKTEDGCVGNLGVFDCEGICTVEDVDAGTKKCQPFCDGK